MMKKTASVALLTVAALASATSVFSQASLDEPSALSFNAGITSDYRYRGLSQSAKEPAFSAGADYAHQSGLYAGAWVSTINWVKDAGGNGSVEIDLYGGYKGVVTGDIGFDVGLLQYYYPANDLKNAGTGMKNANTLEAYGALTYGPFVAKYSHSTTPLFGVANSKGSGYVDLSANIDLGSGYSAVPHVGYQRVAKNDASSYLDYSVALNKDLNGLIYSVSFVGTNFKERNNIHSIYPGSGDKSLSGRGMVFALKKAFN
jgi:uncharacterized protein (TIGR02001 family)